MITWKELVIHGLFKHLKDPNIVIYFINILKPIRRTFLENESREWHQSLRIKQEERWNRVSNLMHKKNYNQIHSSVPFYVFQRQKGDLFELLNMKQHKQLLSYQNRACTHSNFLRYSNWKIQTSGSL